MVTRKFRNELFNARAVSMEVARFLVLPVIVVLPLEATHKETQMHVDADCGAVAGADSDFGSTDLS